MRASRCRSFWASWCRSFCGRQEGSVILETALLMTILLMLLFGIIDIGRVLFTANNLTSAAREGARYGAVDLTVATNDGPTKNKVRAHFSPFGGDTLTNSEITVTAVSVGGGPTQSVRVTIAYPFKWITPVPKLLGWTGGGSFTSTVHAQAEYKYEF